MMPTRLGEIARAIGAEPVVDDVVIERVATDTRTLSRGDLFVALVGERHDGHDFVAAAAQAGAAAAVVDHRVDVALPQLVVPDTQHALGNLARAVRSHHGARIVGITGSNGKTTVKTLTAAILTRHGRTHVNAGNFNNEIGLPLTLLAMPTDAQYAVLEMGAGKPGDIDYLAAIARPEIGLVNNIAPAHLERMGTIRNVAATKGALYTHLPADGCAVINADDAYADYFTGLAGARRTLRFGLLSEVDVGARIDALGATSRFTLLTPAGEIAIDLPLSGRHNVGNALAAATIALALEVPLATIRDGLEQAQPVAGRLVAYRDAQGWTLIDDSYNANPGSVAAAIETLALGDGPAWLVLGDMAELGVDAERLHAQIGELAAERGIARLYSVGRLSRAAASAFGANARHFNEQAALIATLRAELGPGVTCLVKGSRSAGMERVVAALRGSQGDIHAA
jgi:UDP-N-acetylmuramoyl-tripeptide--D-alanyl-D-alanine ligase